MLLALRRYTNSLRNLFLDLRIGNRFLGGGHRTQYATGRHNVGNTDYTAAAEMFRHVTVWPDSVIVDVGCGKGRSTNFLISRFGCKIIGIEIDPELAEQTRERLRRYKNVTIINADIIEQWPEDATIFYLYNSFGASVVEQFCDRLKRHPRSFELLYYNPVHRDIFERHGFVVEFHDREKVAAFKKRLAERDKIHDFCVVRPKHFRPENRPHDLVTPI